MADLRQLFQSFNPSPAFSYTGMKYKLIPDHFEDLNSAMSESFNDRYFFPETFLACQQPELPVTNTNFFPYSFKANFMNSMPVLHDIAMASNSEDACQDSEKRKVLEQSTSSSIHVSSIASGSRLKVKNDKVKRINSRKGKKSMDHKQEVDESEEVIHVKARRGQATDKHSLAERVRREKINSKLRRLQILVPGCYKTMGMASMLDEIINYIHSLKNQVEFLSMELSAASSLYGYNLEAEVISSIAESSQGGDGHPSKFLKGTMYT